MDAATKDNSIETLVDNLLNTKLDSLHVPNLANLTASQVVKDVIEILDSNLSELDPVVAIVMAACIPTLILVLLFACARFNKCRFCCFCCFGRRLLPNTDAKDDIIGDEDFDAEAIHTDPKITSRKKHKGKAVASSPDDPAPISPTTEGSDEEYDGHGGRKESEDDAEDEEEAQCSTPSKPSSYEKNSKACCGAVAACLENE